MLLLFHQQKQNASVRPDTKPDLTLGIGEFFVTQEGVEALFHPPLEKLSDFYTWRGLPFVVSAAHSLAHGKDESVLDRLTRRIGLSMIDMDMLNLEPAEAKPLVPVCMTLIKRDTEALKAWSFDLASKCPVDEISDLLRRLAEMSTQEIDRYVDTFL